jgi:3-oxoacyl-[acyl-carrier-protein] synthase III
MSADLHCVLQIGMAGFGAGLTWAGIIVTWQ